MRNASIPVAKADCLTAVDSRACLQDEERLKTSANEAPSLESFNRQLARTDAEFVRFQEMDKDKDAWPGELVTPEEVSRL